MRGALAGALLAVLVACLVSESSAFRPRGVPGGGKGESHIPKKGGKLPMEPRPDSLKPVAIKRDSLDPVMVLSKLMGIGIMSGSFFLKMPQIIKILSTSSVEGLSPMAVYHELPLYSSGVIYHYLQEFPISTYGEMVVVMVQNIMIVILLWIYQQPAVEKAEILSKCLQFVAICAVQLSLPKPVQPILAYANVPLLLSSCVPQILANARQGHTGTLAISTCFMKALGSALRLFTTLAEIGGDFGLLTSYGLSTFLNGWMVLQGWMYRQETARIIELARRKRLGEG